MMNYANYMGQNPYNMINPHPSLYAGTMQQIYGNPQPQTQVQVQQPTQSQQTITTQPPIMQPQTVSKITQVLNKEEATGSPVDLINGIPSFFYNKSNGEIYLKQFDVPSGTAIFKTYVQTQEKEEMPSVNVSQQKTDYEKEFEYLREGIDGLYRKLEQMQQPVYIKEVNTDVIDIEPDEHKPSKGKKNA